MLLLKNISKISVLLVILYISETFGEKYECFTLGNICVLYDINSHDGVIEPQAVTPDDITQVSFNGGAKKYTRGVCEAFSNLNKFSLPVGLTETVANAFEKCTKLKELELLSNQFDKIDKNSFKGLTSLEKLWLSDGVFPIVDLDLTDSKDLKVLAMRRFYISVFPAEILREQSKLEELDLHSNLLFDLNIEKILEYAPHLKKIYFNDNNFKCTRLRTILKVLKEKNVTVDLINTTPFLRTYTPEKVEEILCLSDEQWNLELSKKSPEVQAAIKNA